MWVRASQAAEEQVIKVSASTRYIGQEQLFGSAWLESFVVK